MRLTARQLWAVLLWLPAAGPCPLLLHAKPNGQQRVEGIRLQSLWLVSAGCPAEEWAVLSGRRCGTEPAQRSHWVDCCKITKVSGPARPWPRAYPWPGSGPCRWHQIVDEALSRSHVPGPDSRLLMLAPGVQLHTPTEEGYRDAVVQVILRQKSKGGAKMEWGVGASEGQLRAQPLSGWALTGGSCGAHGGCAHAVFDRSNEGTQQRRSAEWSAGLAAWHQTALGMALPPSHPARGFLLPPQLNTAGAAGSGAGPSVRGPPPSVRQPLAGGGGSGGAA